MPQCTAMCVRPALNAIMIMTERRTINQHEREPNTQQRVRELIPAFAAHEARVEFSSWKLNTGMEDVDMSRVKQAPKRKRLTRAAKAAGVPALGAAGLGLSLVGSASASALPTADVPQSLNTTPNQRFVLGEEEMADVSLATFFLFDRESGTAGLTHLARGGCGGCHGCGGGGGCHVGGGGGCHVGGCGGGGGCRIGIGGCGTSAATDNDASTAGYYQCGASLQDECSEPHHPSGELSTSERGHQD